MKKFITIVPLQPENNLNAYHYEPIGNEKLKMDQATRFPIMTALSGYVKSGEKIRIIAVLTEDPNAERNFEILKEEVASLSKAKDFKYEVKCVNIPKGDDISSHIDNFQKLIDVFEDNDELYVCMTYGTKVLSNVLILAVQYAYRLLSNVSMSCVVYGMIDRSDKDREKWSGIIHDVTALVHLDEVLHILSDQHVQKPKEFLTTLLDDSMPEEKDEQTK